jgi:hypothetical protein
MASVPAIEDLDASWSVTGLTFPDARHLVSAAEWHHWDGTSELVGPDPTAVQAPLADQLRFVDDGEDIAPGVQVRATPGHTPGHLSLVVTDPAGRTEQRVVILGDVMHCQVQVVESEWSFRFDVDPAQGVATRQQLLKEIEDGHTILAGGHFAGTVFGRVLPPCPVAPGRSNDRCTSARPAPAPALRPGPGNRFGVSSPWRVTSLAGPCPADRGLLVITSARRGKNVARCSSQDETPGGGELARTGGGRHEARLAGVVSGRMMAGRPGRSASVAASGTPVARSARRRSRRPRARCARWRAGRAGRPFRRRPRSRR